VTLAGIESELIKPLERLECPLITPRQSRRPGQALDVFRAERADGARLRQRVISIAPGPSFEGTATLDRSVLHETKSYIRIVESVR
jgi:hypothetical protein